MKKTLKNKQKNCISNHNGNIEGEKISMKLIFFKIVSPTNQHAWLCAVHFMWLCWKPPPPALSPNVIESDPVFSWDPATGNTTHEAER